MSSWHHENAIYRTAKHKIVDIPNNTMEVHWLLLHWISFSYSHSSQIVCLAIRSSDHITRFIHFEIFTFILSFNIFIYMQTRWRSNAIQANVCCTILFIYLLIWLSYVIFFFFHWTCGHKYGGLVLCSWLKWLQINSFVDVVVSTQQRQRGKIHQNLSSWIIIFTCMWNFTYKYQYICICICGNLALAIDFWQQRCKT